MAVAFRGAMLAILSVIGVVPLKRFTKLLMAY